MQGAGGGTSRAAGNRRRSDGHPASSGVMNYSYRLMPRKGQDVRGQEETEIADDALVP